jgi:hypothetical protein
MSTIDSFPSSDGADVEKHRKFLARADRMYRVLVVRTRAEYDRGRQESALRWVQVTARLAANAHTGRYVDGSLENMPFDLGGKPLPQSDIDIPEWPAAGRRRVLHVATRLLPTGGHTRLLARWITHDSESIHHLIVTDQREDEIPEFVSNAVRQAGGLVITTGHEDRRLLRAAAVRLAAQRLADVCVLHTHQFDPVPVIAFAAGDVPPVIAVNHADHQFWMGASVSDAIVNLRTFAEMVTARRGIRAAYRLPIPLRPVESRISRADARRQLGVGEGEVMLLTIGTAPKLRPNEWQDYWATVREILDRFPCARLFIVGVDEKSALRRLGAKGMSRVHAVGFQSEPTPYLMAADLYLEGYPYGSLTAVLDAAAHGVCPVLQYAPTVQADVSDSHGLRRATTPTQDRAEYIAYVGGLIENADLRRRLGSMARQDTRSWHMGEGWKDLVRRIYAEVITAGHHPLRLAETVPSQAEHTDLLRAHWDSGRYSRYPLAAVAAPEAGSLKMLAALIALSLRHGDTRVRLRDALAWGGMLLRHFRYKSE